MTRSLSLSLLAAASLASGLLAQRTVWIVDAAGGSGSQFVEIQGAVDAASPGDLIRVRPGDYGRFTVSKGVSIVGPGARVAGAILFPAITAADLPAGQSLVVSGLAAVRGTGGIGVVRCDGSVLLQGVQADRVVVSDCGAVTLLDNTIGDSLGALALTIMRSDVAIDRGRIIGGAGGPRGATFPALTLVDSSLTASRATITGGSPIFFPGTAPSPAMTTDRTSTVWLTGDGSGLLSGGGSSVDTITGGATVTLSPRANLLGTIAASATVRHAPVPSLAADQDLGVRTIDLAARAGDPYATVLGVPSVPGAVPGVHGAVWFDLARPTIVFDAGVVPAAARVVRQYSAPVSPHLVGLAFVWQSVTLAAGQLHLSNPSAYALSD